MWVKVNKLRKCDLRWRTGWEEDVGESPWCPKVQDIYKHCEPHCHSHRTVSDKSLSFPMDEVAEDEHCSLSSWGSNNGNVSIQTPKPPTRVKERQVWIEKESNEETSEDRLNTLWGLLLYVSLFIVLRAHVIREKYL